MQTVLSNAVVSWLHSSLRGLEKMRPLLTHTLDVVAIHIKYVQLSSTAAQTK
jgi:hypothetical protein